MNCDSACVKVVDGGAAADTRAITFTTESTYTDALETLLREIRASEVGREGGGVLPGSRLCGEVTAQ